MKRNTIQKQKILEYLRKTYSHPNAETVYNHLKKEIPTISLATVYRNLNQMADDGVIDKINIDNEQRFDGQKEDHIHIISKDKIIDIENKKIINEIKSFTKKYNYTAKNIKVIVEVENGKHK